MTVGQLEARPMAETEVKAHEQEAHDEVMKLIAAHPVIKAHLMHKLGNIVCGIRGYSELLDRPGLTEAQTQNYTASIRLGCDRLYNFLAECAITNRGVKNE